MVFEIAHGLEDLAQPLVIAGDSRETNEALSPHASHSTPEQM
jgi:hypothetical protein